MTDTAFTGERVLLTEEQAAAVLGVKPRLMRDLRAQRRIGFVRVGRLVRYRQSDLSAFVDEHAVSPRR